MNGSLALGILSPWPAVIRRPEGRGSFAKLVQRLARLGGLLRALDNAAKYASGQGGELVLADPVPPGQGARFELRLPLAEPPRRPTRLAYAASRR